MTMALFMDLGEYLARKRIAKGFSYRELEDKSGVSFATIQDIESGKTKDPGVTKIFKLLKALSIHPSDIEAVLDGKDPDSIPDKETESQDELLLQQFQEFLRNRKRHQ